MTPDDVVEICEFLDALVDHEATWYRDRLVARGDLDDLDVAAIVDSYRTGVALARDDMVEELRRQFADGDD